MDGCTGPQQSTVDKHSCESVSSLTWGFPSYHYRSVWESVNFPMQTGKFCCLECLLHYSNGLTVVSHLNRFSRNIVHALPGSSCSSLGDKPRVQHCLVLRNVTFGAEEQELVRGLENELIVCICIPIVQRLCRQTINVVSVLSPTVGLFFLFAWLELYIMFLLSTRRVLY